MSFSLVCFAPLCKRKHAEPVCVLAFGNVAAKLVCVTLGHISGKFLGEQRAGISGHSRAPRYTDGQDHGMVHVMAWCDQTGTL